MYLLKIIFEIKTMSLPPVSAGNLNNPPYNPPEKKKKEKKGREIVAYSKNLAPSVKKVDDLADEIIQHSNVRIQLFFLTAIALFGRAVRTKGSPSEVIVEVKGANRQVGQAKRKSGNHAAHSNASANVVDNWKDLCIKQIVNEGLTPKKEQFLSKAKKIPLKILKELQAKHNDQQFVMNTINSYWPENSLLEGTRLIYILNSTTQLPAALNLVCDRKLEMKIRPKMAELFRKVMRGELSPREATKLYVQEIRSHFTVCIKELTEKTIESPHDEKAKKQLFYHTKELEGSQEISYGLISRDYDKKGSDLQPIIDVEKTFDLFL